MPIPIINEKTVLENLKTQENKFFEEYYAFYSSWFGGIIKNPSMMLLPMDDHMVHRGDGVFEAIKAVNRKIYLLDEHLNRLFYSADKISLKSNYSVEKVKQIVIETLLAANQNDAMIRIFLSRGPGNFSVNPYDSIDSQLYVIVHKLHHPPAIKHEQGVIIGKSNIALKPSWMAQVKSCNYLPNVLMKKEAVDRKLDFVIGVDEDGHITESATENIIFVDQDGCIAHPKLNSILKGITMTRTCELALENGFNTKIKSISFDDLQSVREVMITGTTLNILPVVQFENKLIGDGKPGPITKKLQELILTDIHTGVKSMSY